MGALVPTQRYIKAVRALRGILCNYDFLAAVRCFVADEEDIVEVDALALSQVREPANQKALAALGGPALGVKLKLKLTNKRRALPIFSQRPRLLHFKDYYALHFYYTLKAHARRGIIKHGLKGFGARSASKAKGKGP